MHLVTTRPLLIPFSLPFWSHSHHTTASQSPATLSPFWDLHVSSSPTLLPTTHSSTPTPPHPLPIFTHPSCPPNSLAPVRSLSPVRAYWENKEQRPAPQAGHCPTQAGGTQDPLLGLPVEFSPSESSVRTMWPCSVSELQCLLQYILFLILIFRQFGTKKFAFRCRLTTNWFCDVGRLIKSLLPHL